MLRTVDIFKISEKKDCLKIMTYNDRYKLDKHILVEHEGIRYTCRFPDCTSKSEYRDESNLYAHERKKHGITYTNFLLHKGT